MELFTEFLNYFSKMFNKLISCDIMPADYTDIQKRLPEIIAGYQAGNYHKREYETLSNLYYLLLDEARETLNTFERG